MRSHVPGGTVERMTIVGHVEKRTADISVSTASSARRSHEPSSCDGVPTATIAISTPWTAAPSESKKCMRPAATCF